MLLFILGLCVGIFVGCIINTAGYYNGSIRLTDEGIDLDIVDSERFNKQRYILLSVRHPRK